MLLTTYNLYYTIGASLATSSRSFIIHSNNIFQTSHETNSVTSKQHWYNTLLPTTYNITSAIHFGVAIYNSYRQPSLKSLNRSSPSASVYIPKYNYACGRNRQWKFPINCGITKDLAQGLMLRKQIVLFFLKHQILLLELMLSCFYRYVFYMNFLRII